MSTFNREEVLEKLTKMVEKGEEFIEMAQTMEGEFREFQSEIVNLLDTDQEFKDINQRAEKIHSFFDKH